MTLKKRLRYAFETALAYLAYGFFGLLPAETASNLGGRIFTRLGPHLGISRTALRNLARALPETTEEQRHEILHDMWDNLGRTLAEYPHLPRIRETIEVVGGDILDAVRESGKPAIFFGAHLANWEVNALCAKRYGITLALVYRKPNNPWVDGLLRHAREAGAESTHIAKGRSGGREILSVLKNGGSVGIMIDQKMNEGIPVPFFGIDAMTAPAIAHFALRLGVPVYPVRAERLGPAKFRVTVLPAIAIADTGDMDADAPRIMRDIHAFLEDWIRARPGQWLWLHRRWPE